MKKILTLLFFIVVSFSVAQTYTIPKDSITSWRTKSTQRNATLDEYLDGLIYKNIQAISSSTAAGNTASISITNTVCGVGSYSVTAGAVKLEFLSNSAFTGSVNGISYPSNLYGLYGNYQSRTIPAFTWTVSTGSVTVIQTR